MSDPIPINLAAIEARATQAEMKQIVVSQEESQARFVEDVEMWGANPAFMERTQARFNRFRNLGTRRRDPEKTEKRVEGVAKKTEEDLANSYNRRNPELPPDRLRELRDGLRQSGTAEEVLKDVNDLFSDPTLADEALEYLEKETHGELQNSVRKAREILNEQKGREIIAGRNIDQAAKSYQKQGVGTSSELRNLYRDITGNPRDHNTLFTELSNKYPFEKLKAIVAFLLKGMAYDLKSKGPSIQQAELMLLMTEVRNLQSILWIYLFFKSRMRMIRSLYAQFGLDYDEISHLKCWPKILSTRGRALSFCFETT